MNPFIEQWSKLVMASVAPVVVISASGLLGLAFYNRLAAIVSRLRSVQRERLQEQSAYLSATLRRDQEAMHSHSRLLENLSQQTTRIIGRAKLIRLTLRCLLLAVAMLIFASLLNGAALLWAPLVLAAAIMFGGGMISLLVGVLVAMRELSSSLDVIELETRLVSQLTDHHETAMLDATAVNDNGGDSNRGGR